MGPLFLAIDAGWGMARRVCKLGLVARCSTVVLRDFIFDEPRPLSSSLFALLFDWVSGGEAFVLAVLPCVFSPDSSSWSAVKA